MEKRLAPGKHTTKQRVLLFAPLPHRMEQKGQQVEAGQKRRQLLLAMTKVVLQMIALGLAHVVVFDLSEPPTHLCHRHHVSGWQAMIGDTAIVLEVFARFGMDDRALEPMDRPGLITPAQEYIYALVLWGTTLAQIERDAVKALMQQCVQGEIAARITFPAGKSFIVDYNLLIRKVKSLCRGEPAMQTLEETKAA